MIEKSVLWVTCKKCQHSWPPFGNKETTLPANVLVRCPKCDFEEEQIWTDSETGKKYAQKKLGLLGEKEITPHLVELTKQIELLQKELELEKTKREVLEGRMEQIDDWKNRCQAMFDEIEAFYNDEKEFREDNK